MQNPQRNKHGEIVFPDHQEFRPNLTPIEIFKMGSFGGTYWRPIYSEVTGKYYKNIHKQYPDSWWQEIPEDHLTRPWEDYDTKINRYHVKVGQTLEEWENKEWITEYNPYGWVHWYCDFYLGKRCPDDDRQIKRWQSTGSPNGRFAKWLVKMKAEKSAKWNDYSISPKIHQTLQHWAYTPSKHDFDKTKIEYI